NTVQVERNISSDLTTTDTLQVFRVAQDGVCNKDKGTLVAFNGNNIVVVRDAGNGSFVITTDKVTMTSGATVEASDDSGPKGSAKYTDQKGGGWRIKFANTVKNSFKSFGEKVKGAAGTINRAFVGDHVAAKAAPGANNVLVTIPAGATSSGNVILRQSSLNDTWHMVYQLYRNADDVTVTGALASTGRTYPVSESREDEWSNSPILRVVGEQDGSTPFIFRGVKGRPAVEPGTQVYFDGSTLRLAYDVTLNDGTRLRQGERVEAAPDKFPAIKITIKGVETNHQWTGERWSPAPEAAPQTAPQAQTPAPAAGQAAVTPGLPDLMALARRVGDQALESWKRAQEAKIAADAENAKADNKQDQALIDELQGQIADWEAMRQSDQQEYQRLLQEAAKQAEAQRTALEAQLRDANEANRKQAEVDAKKLEELGKTIAAQKKALADAETARVKAAEKAKADAEEAARLARISQQAAAAAAAAEAAAKAKSGWGAYIATFLAGLGLGWLIWGRKKGGAAGTSGTGIAPVGPSPDDLKQADKQAKESAGGENDADKKVGDALQKAVAAVDDKAKQLPVPAKAAASVPLSMRETLKKLQERLDQLKAELRKLQEQLPEIEKNDPKGAPTFRGDIEKKKAQVVAQQAVVDRVNGILGAGDVEQNYAALQAMIQEGEKQADQLHQEINQRVLNRDRFAKDLETTEDIQKKKDYPVFIATLNGEISDRQGRLTALEARLETARGNLAFLKQQIAAASPVVAQPKAATPPVTPPPAAATPPAKPAEVTAEQVKGVLDVERQELKRLQDELTLRTQQAEQETKDNGKVPQSLQNDIDRLTTEARAQADVVKRLENLLGTDPVGAYQAMNDLLLEFDQGVANFENQKRNAEVERAKWAGDLPTATLMRQREIQAKIDALDKVIREREADIKDREAQMAVTEMVADRQFVRDRARNVKVAVPTPAAAPEVKTNTAAYVALAALINDGAVDAKAPAGRQRAFQAAKAAVIHDWDPSKASEEANKKIVEGLLKWLDFQENEKVKHESMILKYAAALDDLKKAFADMRAAAEAILKAPPVATSAPAPTRKPKVEKKRTDLTNEQLNSVETAVLKLGFAKVGEIFASGKPMDAEAIIAELEKGKDSAPLTDDEKAAIRYLATLPREKVIAAIYQINADYQTEIADKDTAKDVREDDIARMKELQNVLKALQPVETAAMQKAIDVITPMKEAAKKQKDAVVAAKASLATMNTARGRSDGFADASFFLDVLMREGIVGQEAVDRITNRIEEMPLQDSTGVFSDEQFAAKKKAAQEALDAVKDMLLTKLAVPAPAAPAAGDRASAAAPIVPLLAIQSAATPTYKQVVAAINEGAVKEGVGDQIDGYR
ncbi:MAG: hypothetical protein HQL18_03245, partial [Candidatus Omnitrophica bacterium]|nr:hypothetical protein [Candidatus Omnitrophota bacterium]